MRRSMLPAALVLAAAVFLPTASRADGSVAHGSGGEVGLSYNFRNPREADRRALRECGEDCQIVRRYEHTCAAIAVGRRGGYGYAFGDREGIASRRAMSECEGHDGGCRIKVTGCDE